MNDWLSTEGLVASGVVDTVWGNGWRAPTSESLRTAEGCNHKTVSPMRLPKRAVIAVFLRELPQVLGQIEREGKTDGRYVIIARDGDSKLVDVLRHGMPPYVQHLFSVYAPHHSRITPMPFALRWLVDVDRVKEANAYVPRTSKNRVLVCHRTLDWLPPDHERFTSNEFFADKPWATVVSSVFHVNPLTVSAYLKEVRSHDFFVVASGDGNRYGGIERHAQWEAMALGAVLICTKGKQSRWADMPVAIVNDWSEVTPEWCEYNLPLLRKHSIDKMMLSYWVEQIRARAKEL